MENAKNQNFFMPFSPMTDYENLNFVAPLKEHRFYGIFCFFGSPAFILKTSPLSKCVRKTFKDHFLQSVVVLWLE